ncbi:MAG: hypothetical protein HZB50_03585 [Chloroflexi bacterium]|nr:hypothetical protein [Chloroflexota bacterium]
MKSLFTTILDGLTYKDLSGHRQPRAYTVMSALILFFLLIAIGMSALHRYLLMSSVKTAPISISLSTEVPPQLPAPTQPTGDILIDCPVNAGEWSLTPTYISQNYQVIQPACVYMGLEKTIAWALAVREGYSRAEATELLGFDEMPIKQLERVMIPTDNGLSDVPVSFIPPNPDLAEWRLDSNNKPAVTYALRGCFRTSTVVGNRVEVWGSDYSVICLVVEDADNTHIVYSLKDHIYTADAIPMRSFLFFGYGAEQSWEWIGTQVTPKVEITDPASTANEREVVALMYDSEPWDAKWLMDHYRLMMKTLPENWQSMTDESEKQAILTGLMEVTP